jgi:hypothetical protein
MLVSETSREGSYDWQSFQNFGVFVIGVLILAYSVWKTILRQPKDIGHLRKESDEESWPNIRRW